MMIEPLQLFNFAFFIIGSLFVLGCIKRRNYRLFVGVLFFLAGRLVFFAYLFYTRLVLQISHPTEAVTFVASVSSSIEAVVFAMYAVYFYKRCKTT